MLKDVEIWEKGTFDEWELTKDGVFIVKKNGVWVGIYHWQQIEKIIVED